MKNTAESQPTISHQNETSTTKSRPNNIPNKKPKNKTHLFTFMGTGAGCGVPAFFCTCPACMEARENPHARRGDCGAMIRRIQYGESNTLPRTNESVTPSHQDKSTAPSHLGEHNTTDPLPSSVNNNTQIHVKHDALDILPVPPENHIHTPTLLIDAPPDTRHQLLREGVTHFDELLITHCHSDHITGLCEYEYMMQLRTKKPVPTFGSVEALGEIAVEFHYMDYALDMHTIEPFETHIYDGVRYTALPVTHAEGTFGYLIETPNTHMFYASDTGLLPPETRERIQNIDILAMDATYWKTCPCPQSHHSVQECIEEGLELNAKKIYLTHLCMHYSEPITLAELEDYCEQYNGRVSPAYDGATLAI